jgi:hypothetical protein
MSVGAPFLAGRRLAEELHGQAAVQYSCTVFVDKK